MAKKKKTKQTVIEPAAIQSAREARRLATEDAMLAAARAYGGRSPDLWLEAAEACKKAAGAVEKLDEARIAHEN